MKTAVIDIGGTAIKAGIFENGKVTQVREYQTQAWRGAEAVLQSVIEIIEAGPAADAIGVSTTGQIDAVEGKVSFAGPNIPGYQGLEIGKILSDHFGVRAAVENDVNAAALGEAHYGAGRTKGDFLCLTYGTGIGGAIIENGELYRGHHYAAGEFGGIVVHPEDCNRTDPFSGCYERYASVTALVDQAKKVCAELTSGRDIFAHAKEPEVAAVINDWVDEIAIGLVTLIHIFNPSAILLGGGVMNQKILPAKIQQQVTPAIMESFRDVQILKTQLGNEAGMYGAAYLAQ